MSNTEWFDIIKKDNLFLELYDKDTHYVYISPLTVIPIIIIGFVVWYIQILFKKIKGKKTMNKALWSCRHCGEEFITQYDEYEVSEDFEIEELCYDDFRDHVTDCLGITESDIRIIKHSCKKELGEE